MITSTIPASTLDALIALFVEQSERPTTTAADAERLRMAAVVLRTARRTQRPVVIGI